MLSKIKATVEIFMIDSLYLQGVEILNTPTSRNFGYRIIITAKNEIKELFPNQLHIVDK